MKINVPRLITLLSVIVFSFPISVLAKDCKNSQPCGNTCIALNKVCHVDAPTPASEPTDDLSSDSTSTAILTYDEGVAAGIEQCKRDPSACGIVINQNTHASTQEETEQCQQDLASYGSTASHATYDPKKGELYIPVVEVPGDAEGSLRYEVYLLQKSDSFIFDLDLNRIKSH